MPFKNTRAYKLAENIANLNEDVMFKVVMSNEVVKTEIIRLNQIEQLFKKGIDSDGISLGGYKPITINIKRRKGQRIANVTLSDSGRFYDTFDVEIGKDDIKIVADGDKDDKNLFDVYGEAITGLTNESINKLIIFARNRFISYIKNQIFTK